MAKFDEKTFNPNAFGKYVNLVPRLRNNEFISSKALRINSQIKETFSNSTGVVYATIPMFDRLGGEALNYDGVTDIEADTTSSFERGVVVIGRAKAWVEKDFYEDITGGAGFMDSVGKQISDYWEDIDSDTLSAILNGVFKMNGAGNDEFVEKHTFDISATSNPNVGVSTLNSTIQKASGDKKSVYSLVIMHSTIATNLENLQLLDYMKYTDPRGIERQLQMGTWNGRTVLIDDNMPSEDVGGYTKYTTYVLGHGAFDYADIGAEVPFAMARDEKKNGGMTTLYSRQRKVFAPYGISFKKAFMETNSPTVSELKRGENWNLVNDGNGKFIDHRAIPIARIISRG